MIKYEHLIWMDYAFHFKPDFWRHFDGFCFLPYQITKDIYTFVTAVNDRPNWFLYYFLQYNLTHLERSYLTKTYVINVSKEVFGSPMNISRTSYLPCCVWTRSSLSPQVSHFVYDNQVRHLVKHTCVHTQIVYSENNTTLM